MLKILNNKYTKISLIFIIFLYFYITIDLNALLIELKLLNKYYFLLSIFLFFPNSFLLIYKWSLLTKKFKKNHFTSLYKKFSFIFFIADIIHNPALVDVTKFVDLKKISSFEKTAIIINDKLIIILSKVIYTFFFLFLLNQNKIIEFISIIFDEKKIYLLFIILSALILTIILKFKIFFIKYYQKYLSAEIIERRKIFLIEIIRNVLMSCLYFLSFLQFTSFEDALLLASISPLVETFIRLQFITTFGFRELILFLIGNYLGLDQNIILSSLFITFVTLSTSSLNFLLSLFIKSEFKVKKFKNNINFIINDNKNPGNNDFYDLIKLISKNNKMIRYDNKLNLNFKKIIIQENFLNPIYFIRLLIFCIFYKGKLLIFLTEFFTKTNNGITYNIFNKNEYAPNNLFLLLLFLLYYKTSFFLGYNSEKISNMYYNVYHKLRYLSTVFFSRYAYGFVIAHPQIKIPLKILKNKKIILFPYIFPTIKYNKKWQSKNCKFLLEFTGQLTSYRKKKIVSLKLSEKIFDLNQIKNLYKFRTNSFIDNNKMASDKKIYFSYHFEKNQNWRHSSPTRYFNSLKNSKIPIVSKKFNDIFSKVCLSSKILNEKSKIKILKKIQNLNQKIYQVNNQNQKYIYNLVNF
jgi:hypothetical protein